ncbi:MAG: hypothetical protein IPK68_20895 [Bdellovibrionales bacterium]|nr:hypothetical protein [Bdellovibrionales bacterium]
MGEWIIRVIISLVMTLSFLVISASTLGEEAGDAKKRRTSINFEDELIEGEVKKPELFYLLQKKQFNFKRLIKLRENFLPEMRRTAEDMPRGGSSD